MDQFIDNHHRASFIKLDTNKFIHESFVDALHKKRGMRANPVWEDVHIQQELYVVKYK